MWHKNLAWSNRTFHSILNCNKADPFVPATAASSTSNQLAETVSSLDVAKNSHGVPEFTHPAPLALTIGPSLRTQSSHPFSFLSMKTRTFRAYHYQYSANAHYSAVFEKCSHCERRALSQRHSPPCTSHLEIARGLICVTKLINGDKSNHRISASLRS